MTYRRERIAVARHEAGHVFMRVHLQRHLTYAEITSRPHYGLAGTVVGDKRKGYIDGYRARHARVEDDIMISLAGPEAERRFWCEIGREESFEPIRNACPQSFPFKAGDYVDALWSAVQMCGGLSEEATACLHWLHLRVQRILDLPEAQPSIEAVAHALLEQGRVTGATLRRLVHTATEATRPDPAALRQRFEAIQEAHRRGEHPFVEERLGDPKTVFAYLPRDLFSTPTKETTMPRTENLGTHARGHPQARRRREVRVHDHRFPGSRPSAATTAAGASGSNAASSRAARGATASCATRSSGASRRPAASRRAPRRRRPTPTRCTRSARGCTSCARTSRWASTSRTSGCPVWPPRSCARRRRRATASTCATTSPPRRSAPCSSRSSPASASWRTTPGCSNRAARHASASTPRRRQESRRPSRYRRRRWPGSTRRCTGPFGTLCDRTFCL